MASITRLTTAISALSFITSTQATAVFPRGDDVCLPTTTTVFTTVTVQEGWTESPSATAAAVVAAAETWSSSSSQTQQWTAPGDFSYPGVSFPTFSPGHENPNGPFYNPNDFIPFGADWPGKPSGKGATVPARPTKAPKPSGGYSAGSYQSPAWQGNGQDLTPGMSQGDTNGDSPWGQLGCPPLSSYAGAPSGTVSASATKDHKGHKSHAKVTTTTSSGYGRPSKSAVSKSDHSKASKSAHSKASKSAHSNLVKESSSSSSFATYTSKGNYSVTSQNRLGATSSVYGVSSLSSFGPLSSIPSTISSFSQATSRPSSFSSFSSLSSLSSIASNSTSACKKSRDTSAICDAMPETGVVRHYDLAVSYGTIAPDGVQKNGVLVNGQFPGPLIEANYGDWIQVTVTNELPSDSTDQGEGTSLHWHGFLQHETPYYDGVPSVQQCPLAPGKSLTYKFRADHIGTSWYHSHYSAQYAGGAFGPIVIHGPVQEEVCYDEDLGPVMVGDWYHADYYSLVEKTMAGGLPLSDNILINGKMNYPCENTTAVCTPNAGISKFSFKAGKKYRLRLINPSAEAIVKFHIDNHNFSVIANDFVPIKPYDTNVVTLGVGQRSDVVVEATGKPGDSFWMRATAGNAFTANHDGGCSATSGVITEGVAAVYYEGADTNSVPTTTSSLTTAQLNQCANDDLSLTQSYCPFPLEDDSKVANEDITIAFASNGTNFVYQMTSSTLNASSFRADYNVNLLDQVANDKNMTFQPEWNVQTFDESKTSIRMHIVNTFVAPHPMHLHGHDFNVLASGVGDWDGTIVNPSNTQARDVQILEGAGGYIVIQFKKNNPGVWPLHCHLAWHVSAGLYINVLEAPQDITYSVPAEVQQTCSDWAAWEARGNVPDQIDSGL